MSKISRKVKDDMAKLFYSNSKFSARQKVKSSAFIFPLFAKKEGDLAPSKINGLWGRI
jgi:hypothetical protein